MPFTPVTYNTGAGPGIDGPAMNALQVQWLESILSFNPNLFTPFVFSGLVCTKDGTVLSQLDVTSGTAYPRQSGQSELRQRKTTATTFSASGHASATLFLDLNSDGTWSWGTAHSADANHLTICTVTTDASSNIATVTDTRQVNTTVLFGMAGILNLIARGPNGTVGAFSISAGNGAPASLAANEIYIQLT